MKKRKGMSKKVPVQKGKLIANPPTQGMATYGENVMESNKDMKLRRSGMKNHLKKPKQ